MTQIEKVSKSQLQTIIIELSRRIDIVEKSVESLSFKLKPVSRNHPELVEESSKNTNAISDLVPIVNEIDVQIKRLIRVGHRIDDIYSLCEV